MEAKLANGECTELAVPDQVHASAICCRPSGGKRHPSISESFFGRALATERRTHGVRKELYSHLVPLRRARTRSVSGGRNEA